MQNVSVSYGQMMATPEKHLENSGCLGWSKLKSSSLWSRHYALYLAFDFKATAIALCSYPQLKFI